MTIGIVIPVYGRPELTRQVLEQLTGEPDVSVLVVDNRGDWPEDRRASVLRPGTNLGYWGGCNAGIEVHRAAGIDACVVMNNDVQLSPGFCSGLDGAAKRSGAAVVGPCFNGVYPQQASDFAGPVSEYVGRAIERPAPLLEGTCLYVPMAVFDAVGPFDAALSPRYGWATDIDFALRVRAAGLTLAVTEAAVMHHLDHATVKDLEPEDWERHAALEMAQALQAKWGNGWQERLTDGYGQFLWAGDYSHEWNPDNVLAAHAAGKWLDSAPDLGR